MQVDVEWDVLVVGAGPAGSCAAFTAASLGAKTLLIDSKTRIGEQPHCGEFVPRQLFAEWVLPKESIMQHVHSMETWIIDLNDTGRVLRKTVVNSPGFLIDRIRFDKELARRASSVGAAVLSAARFVRKQVDLCTLHVQKKDWTIKTKVIIAADGALSSVASAIGINRAEYLRGVQVEAPLSELMDRTYVFLCRDLVGGYGWLFPKGHVANVGLGVVPSINVSPRELLDRLLTWLHELGILRSGRLSRTSGVIPVSGIRPQLVKENVIFTGDAAGLTHPITGAGIAQAVFSGLEAGKAAFKAVETSRYGGNIAHARSKRLTMMSMWNEPDFAKVCGRTWIAFNGYRKRES